MSAELTRRQLLAGAAGAGLMWGFRIRCAAAQDAPDPHHEPNAFIRIAADGVITLVIPQVEMGQGVYTSLAMVLAEELDADWSLIRVEHAPANEKLYANPLLGIQATGNSNSIRAFWMPLRLVGAQARACLVLAAAQRWAVPVAECRTEAGHVMHASSGRRADYGSLAHEAEGLDAPANVPLKDPRDFRIVGRSPRRLDTPTKINGQARYGIDALPPGVKFATLSQSPVLGGSVARVDSRRARQIAGVRQIVSLDDTVAVVGDHMWAAKQGLDALNIVWNDGPNSTVSSDLIWSQLRRAGLRDGALAREVGDAVAALREPAAESGIVVADFELPLLAHAALEPANCTVHVTPTAAEVWTGTQAIARARAAVAKAAGLPEAQVTVHNHLVGGGFGRRLEIDMVYTAARIARQVDGPVKVVWTREEDIRHDMYRPVYLEHVEARLQDNRIVAWRHKVSGSAVLARFLPPGFRNGVDVDGVDSAVDAPYEIPNFRVEFNREEPPAVATAFWRGVGPNANVFAVECFMDELARRAGRDPVQFRREHLARQPRLTAALDLAAVKSGWGSPLPPRCGRGVCAQTSFGSFIATIVECEIGDQGQVMLRRVTSAVDAGLLVHPDTVVAQLQGGLIFGLTAALYGEITLQNGRVQQSNFHDYQMLRINQVPQINVHLIESREPPGGIGEAGTTAAMPALRNAIYAATGIALRRMPIDPTRLTR